MVEVWLPYGSTEIPIRIREENLLGIAAQEAEHSKRLQLNEIPQSITQELEAFGKVSSAGIAYDPTPSQPPTRDIAKEIAKTLVGKGVPKEKISLFRMASTIPLLESASTDPEQYEFRDIGHDTVRSEFHLAGTTSNGTAVHLNRSFIETDLKVVVSTIGTDYAARLCCSATAVLTGLGSAEAISSNLSILVRKAESEDGESKQSEILRDRFEASKLAGVRLLVDGFTDQKGSILRLSVKQLGSFESIVSEARSWLLKPIQRKADIVVVSPGGLPFDSDLFNAVDCAILTTDCVESDGFIIVSAECSQGIGGSNFQEWLARYPDARGMELSLRRRPNLEGVKACLLRRLAEKTRIHLVSTLPNSVVEKVGGIRPSKTATAAMQSAERAMGKEARILVIPNATKAIPSVLAPKSD